MKGLSSVMAFTRAESERVEYMRKTLDTVEDVIIDLFSIKVQGSVFRGDPELVRAKLTTMLEQLAEAQKLLDKL